MYLEKLEIKGFGKINGFSLKFEKGLNVIFGGNEAGKSTIQWFIRGMLFGLKGGRVSKDGLLPPLKRYKPWSGNTYSGSMEYRLDNGCIYRVDRDFERNVVEIYDSNYNNISCSFDVSKERGILFADRHLGINDICFDRTVLVRQMESRLDDDGSSELLNKLTNLSQTGFEDLSYKKAEEALRDALKRYVGTERTTAQPIDRINTRLSELLAIRKRLEDKRNEAVAISNSLQEAIAYKDKLQRKREYLNKVKELIDIRKQIDMGRVKLSGLTELEEIFSEVERELSAASDSHNTLHKENGEIVLPKRSRKSHGFRVIGNGSYIAIALLLVSIVGAFLAGVLYNPPGYIFAGCLLLALVIFVLYQRLVNIKKEAKLEAGNQQELRKEYEQRMQEIQELNGRFKDISNRASLICGKQIESVGSLEKEIDIIGKTMKTLDLSLWSGVNASDLLGMDSDFFSPSSLGDVLFNANPTWLKDSWEYEMDKLNGSMTDNALKIKELETLLSGFQEQLKDNFPYNFAMVRMKSHEHPQKRGSNILSSPQEEGELQNIEEEISSLELKKVEMERIGSSLGMALEVLREASCEIRRDYAPELNTIMGTFIAEITGDRYNVLKADDTLGLRTIAPDSGDVRGVKALSGGTVDQMYLALRLAMANLLSSNGESLPLILDEVFSQYDDGRTVSTMKYLSEKYKNSQVILFTCKARELDIAKMVCGDGLNVIGI